MFFPKMLIKSSHRESTLMEAIPLLIPAPFTERFADRPEVLRRALSAFEASVRENLQSLRTSPPPTPDEVRRTAHDLKGTGLVIGAQRFARAAEHLEKEPSLSQTELQERLRDLETIAQATAQSFRQQSSCGNEAV
jgi:HPt (histidine-containing phosphotransfer) domain-containing protein